MARAAARWRWLLLLLVWNAGGCIFGGQTGEDSASGFPTCTSRSIDFSQASSLGYSAADLLARVGGTRNASLMEVNPGFWPALGINPEPELPLPLVLSISHQTGSTIDHECSRYLSVEVVVSIDLGNGILRRTATATLEGTTQSAELTVVLGPPQGGDAQAGDGSSASVTLDLHLTPTSLQGELLASPSSAARFSGP